MKKTIRFALAGAVSLFALEASAGGFGVHEQSATLQGMSFAGMGTSAGGLSSMFWNPASLTSSPGHNSAYHFSGIIPYASMTPTFGSGPLTANAPGTGNIGLDALVPASYSGYQLTDSIWLGNSVTAPFGLKTKSNFFNAGQFYGRSSKAADINVTPTAAWKVNDWLSLGAGVQIQYFNVRLSQSTPTAPGAAGLPTAFLPTSPSASLAGNGWGMGYTLGATIKPFTNTEIALGFRSAVNIGLNGRIQTAAAVTRIGANLNLPETITVGLRQGVTNDLTLLAGFEWTNWSRIRNPAITVLGTGIPATSLPFYYEDGWMASLGAEYKWNQQLTLRTGFAFESSPISDSTRSVRIPDNDRMWASIGATYNWNDKLSFDVGYSHVFVKDPNINISLGHPSYVTGAANLVASGKAHVDILSIAIKYRWDEPPKPASGAVVRKG